MTHTAATYELELAAPPPPARASRAGYVSPDPAHPHGTRACYVLDGCGCGPCTAASSAYARAYERERRRSGPRTVPAGRVRDHLRWLSAEGVGRDAVHAASGVSASVIDRIRRGQIRRVHPETGKRILAVGTSAAAGGARVDAADTWRRVQALLALGFTKAWIARQLGARTGALQLGPRSVTARTAAAVAALHDAVLAGAHGRPSPQHPVPCPPEAEHG